MQPRLVTQAGVKDIKVAKAIMREDKCPFLIVLFLSPSHPEPYPQ